MLVPVLLLGILLGKCKLVMKMQILGKRKTQIYSNNEKSNRCAGEGQKHRVAAGCFCPSPNVAPLGENPYSTASAGGNNGKSAN